jgi:hypothetical protein
MTPACPRVKMFLSKNLHSPQNDSRFFERNPIIAKVLRAAKKRKSWGAIEKGMECLDWWKLMLLLGSKFLALIIREVKLIGMMQRK